MCEDLIGAVIAVFLKTLREYLVFMDWQHSHKHSKNRSCARKSLQNSVLQDSDSNERGCTDRSFILAKSRSRVTRKKGYVWGGEGPILHPGWEQEEWSGR